MDRTIGKFKDKKILIWGYGREGKSTERFLTTYCEPAAVEVYEGARDGVQDAAYDYVFVSPGIKFEEDAPAFDNAKFTSQTEVFLEEYGAQTVGITGTKGKSTTCSLLQAALLACSGRKTILMGNIGKPCFDYLPEMDGETIAVFELSCHQCQRLQAAPHIAVFLNLYGDHLDRYGTMEHYFDAKCGITRHQTAEDILLLGQQVPEIETKARKIVIAAEPACGRELSSGRLHDGCSVAVGTEKDSAQESSRRQKEGSQTSFRLRIPGAHNQLNALFVYEIAVNLFGCDGDAVRDAMASFAGLPHRLEHCGTFGGVDWYDDSISTIPQAAIQAVESVPHAQTVLIGGMDRGVDYGVLEDFIRAHAEIDFILAYASGERILREMGTGTREPVGTAADTEQPTGKGVPQEARESGQSAAVPGNVYYVEDLAAQVRLAGEITPAGGAVIMSNAAASYGYFKDFEARGEEFKRLIRELPYGAKRRAGE